MTDTDTVTLKVRIKRRVNKPIGTPCAYSWSVFDENGRLLQDWYGCFRWSARWGAKKWCRKYAKERMASEEWIYTASWEKKA